MRRVIGLAAAAAGGYWLATKIRSSMRSEPALEGPGPVRGAPPEGVYIPAPTVGPAARPWEPSSDGDRHPLAMLHREHRSLLSSVAAARATDPEKPHDAKELHATVQRIITDASRHEIAEETHLWPLVRSRVPDGETVAAAACSEELEIKRLLRALDTRRPGDIDFDQLLGAFQACLWHHVESEESRVWPLLDAVLTREEADVLADDLARSEAGAPTRPHPSELADPSKHPVLSKAAGLVDRGVDAIAGRGRGPYSGK